VQKQMKSMADGETLRFRQLT